MNPTADRVDGVDELRLLECTDAAEWGAADLSDVLRQLDEWLARLEQNMEAGMPPPQGLHADGALARRYLGNAMQPMLALFDALASGGDFALLHAGPGRGLRVECAHG